MLDRQIPARAERPAGLVPARDGRSLANCLALMIDEVDYGMLLLDEGGVVCFQNHVATLELDDEHPLQISGGQLRARSRADLAELQEALEAAAHRGVHRLLILGSADNRVSVAVRPLGPRVLDGGPATVLLLGRRRVVQNLSMQFFARTRGLTPAETRVLEGLCAGVPPSRIAEQLGVRISTIRTQISGIREKTGARSIRELVRLVAVLPPMVPALREPGTIDPDAGSR